MTLLDSPTTVTPVFDQATNVVLGNIYNYLKSQQGDTDTREIIERLERINNSTITESRTRGVNDRATQAALRGIENTQRRNGDLSGVNDRATQAALKGIIGNQKKDAGAQAKDRATQKALFGNIDKNTRNMTSALGKFKDAMNNAFSNLKSFLTPFLDKSLKSFTDLSKTMRKANLTRAQKDQIQGMASSAIGDVEKMFDGLQVSRDEINDFMGDLIASGKDLNDMSAEQRASYIALRKRGVADEQAFNQAMTASSNQIKGTVLAMGDPTIAQTLKKATSNITSAMSVSAGGTDKALAQMTENVRGIEAELGNALNPETASKLATVMFKVKNGMIDQMSEEEIMLNTVIHGATDAKSAAEALKKADTATLARMGIVEDNLANIQNYQNSGTKTGKTVRSDDQNKVANSQNTTNGKAQQTFDKLLASLDKSTGGLVGKTANILDEYLGDSADIGTLVKNGFKLVTSSLKTIAFNTGFFGKALMGLGGAAAIVALVANWDKIKPKLAEMFPKIKEAVTSALKNIVPFFKKLIADFSKNIGPFIKDIISGIKSLLPDLGGGIKSVFSGLSGNAGAGAKQLGAMTSSAMAGVDLKGIGSSIGGVLKDIVGGIGDLLGGSSPFFKGILDGIAAILSSFMPELSTIVHDIVECIDRLIDAIAPHIPQIISAVQSVIDIVSKAVDYIAPYIPEIVAAVRDSAIALVEIVPPIVECIRDIGVSFIEGTRDVINNAVTTIGDIINNTVSVIGDVLIAISPAINFIGEAIDVIAKALAPLLPKIVDTIDYGIRTLLPPLVNKIIPELLELFKKILPPILDIVKKAVEVILPPVLEILKIIAENIMPPIQHALDVVIGLIDRIANFLLDVLERIFNLIMNVLEPILTAISELLTSIIKLATTIVDTVKEVVLFIKDVVQVAHGLFNFFTSKIPDLIGWVSGVFNFLSNDIAPIVRSGFKLIYNIIDALYKGLKAIIITAIWPIKKIVDAIDYLFKKVYYFLKTAPYIGDKDDGSNPELVKLRHEVEESKLVLTGHDASEKTEELKKVYEAALQKSGGEYTNEVWTAWKEYKASLEKDGSLRERANEDAINAFKEVAAEAENFSNNVKKAIENGGPKKDEAVVEEVQQYLSGQKGNITNENILPPNTGSLLESITKYTESTLGTLNSIFGLLKSFNSTKLGGGGGPFTSATPATLGEDPSFITFSSPPIVYVSSSDAYFSAAIAVITFVVLAG